MQRCYISSVCVKSRLCVPPNKGGDFLSGVVTYFVVIALFMKEASDWYAQVTL